MPTEEEAAQAAAQAAADNDAKPVTMADLKALFSKDIPTLVNSAVATHTKRLKTDFEKQLAAIKPAPPTEVENANDDTTSDQQRGAKPATPPVERKPEPKAEPNPELDSLRKEIASLKRANEKAAEQAKAEARRRVELEGFTSLKNALSGKVVSGSEDVVLATLKGRGAISISDDGQVRLKFGGKDEPEEGFDLDDGIATYLKSNEAKFFLPVPTGGTNGGKRPNHTGASGNDPMSRLESKTGKAFDDLL